MNRFLAMTAAIGALCGIAAAFLVHPHMAALSTINTYIQTMPELIASETNPDGSLEAQVAVVSRRSAKAEPQVVVVYKIIDKTSGKEASWEHELGKSDAEVSRGDREIYWVSKFQVAFSLGNDMIVKLAVNL